MVQSSLPQVVSRIRSLPRPVLLLVVIIVIALAWWWFGGRSGVSAATIAGSGTIEAEEIAITSEASGRLQPLLIEEGDSVRAGDTLMTVDTALLDAQIEQTKAAIEVSQANLALTEKGSRAEDIRQGEATLAQAEAQRDTAKLAWQNAQKLRDDPQELTAKIDAARPQVSAAQARLDTLKQGARAETVAQAEANLRATQARLQQLKDGPSAEQRRVALQTVEAAKAQLNSVNITKDGNCGPGHPDYQCKASEAAAVAATQAVDAAQASYDALVAAPSETRLTEAQAAVDAAKATFALAQNPYTAQDLQQAEAALAQAQANLNGLLQVRDNPIAANAQIDAAQGQYQAAEAAVQSARARLEALRTGATSEQVGINRAQLRQAEAGLKVLQVQRDKCTIKAPTDGTVLSVVGRAGETALPGMTLLTVADLQSVKLTVFVPESRIGRVQLGQSVNVAVDSYPGQTFTGEVVAISNKAEYTPRNVQTQADRENTVFAVKVKIPNPEGKLKAGMPADAKLEG